MYPKILHIYGPLWINGYGLMIAIGFLVFSFLTYKQIQKQKIISSELFFNTIFVGLIAAILGGRILYVITDWKAFSENWVEALYPWAGGFSVLGSILGVLLTLPTYFKKHQIPILPTCDLLATYAPLLQSISRLGCLLAGCCYGSHASTTLTWAITFTNQDALAPLHIPLHPTQIYSSLASFSIFLVLYSLSKIKHKNGHLLFSYLCLESISRFSLDFFRGDRDFLANPYIFKTIFATFSCSQLIAIIVFIFSLIGLTYTAKK